MSPRSETPRDALLNEALELAMDWGENWLAPIQPRLHERHPRLAQSELDELNRSSQAAMRLGHETAFAMMRSGAGGAADEQQFAERIRAKYPWIDASNATRLHKHSLYFATKTGGPAKDPD